MGTTDGQDVSGLAGEFDVEPLTLVYGLLANWRGVQRVMFAALAVFAALTVLTATAASIGQIALSVILRSLRHVTLANGAWLSARYGGITLSAQCRTGPTALAGMRNQALPSPVSAAGFAIAAISAVFCSCTRPSSAFRSSARRSISATRVSACVARAAASG